MTQDDAGSKRAGPHAPSPRRGAAASLPPPEEDAPPAELELWEDEPVRDWARTWGVPELRIFARTTSTNEEAKRLAERGAPTGSAAIADEQTAGKGRRGRSWYAPHGRALLLSVVLRPPPRTSLRAPTAIPIHVGLAVARAIETVAPVVVGLKWPNDLVIAGSGKIAGILCEGELTGGADFVIAGIGINVNQRAAELPAHVDAHATSLAIASGRETARAQLAASLFAELDSTIRRAGEPLDDAILDEYARRDVLRGAHVVVDNTIRGTANGITTEGALLVDSAAGKRILLSGTVRLVAESSLGYPIGPGAWWESSR